VMLTPILSVIRPDAVGPAKESAHV
jgi:hypothetical protein